MMFLRGMSINEMVELKVKNKIHFLRDFLKK